LSRYMLNWLLGTDTQLQASPAAQELRAGQR